MKDLLKKAFAEFIGTCMLVVIACGCGARFRTGTVSGYLATALVFGVTMTVAYAMFGGLSGCHINPAVSFAMLIDRRMTAKEFFIYIAAQFLGGVAGAGLLAIICALNSHVTAYSLLVNISNGLEGVNGNILSALIAEVVMTFVFVYTFLAATGGKGQGRFAGVTVGFALMLVHMMGLRMTGTSVNPARSFGPALVALFCGRSDPILACWIFIVAPLAGGALAAFIYRFFEGKKNSV